MFMINRSIFREAPSADGKKGPISVRRVLAFIFAMASIVSAILPIFYVSGESITWQTYVPCIIFALCTVILLFFTTWNDVAEVLKIVKSTKE